MPKPLIGLTTTRSLISSGRLAYTMNAPYAKSISSAGGLPVLIPLDLSQEDLDGLTTRLDGILFTGGYDIDPRRYGNQLHPKAVGIDSDRDRVEIHLVRAAIADGKPFLGICRGIQLINVALGGTLYEDIKDQLPGALQHDNHSGHSRDYLAHNVKVAPGCRLVQILIDVEVQVNSLHHQGANRLAQELSATALAPDGLIEAFELPGHPFGLAVQWHPEELQEYAAMRSLFQAFIQSCLGSKPNNLDRDSDDRKISIQSSN
jgi:putative glutamine amidotransferase